MKKALLCLAFSALLLSACGEIVPASSDIVSTPEADSSSVLPPESSSESSEESIPSSEPDDSDLNCLSLTVANWQRVDFIQFENVVPNTSYPNEYTLNSGAKISSDKIHGIEKIVVIQYKDANNIKVYPALEGGEAIVSTSKANSNYNSAYEKTFRLNGVDSFRIENPSSSKVYFFELNIYYSGELDGSLPIEEKEGEILIDKDTYNRHSLLETEGVSVNGDNLVFAPGGYIKSIELGVIDSFVLTGNKGDIKVYGLLDEEATEIPAIKDSDNEYRYEFGDGYDGFSIVNEGKAPIETGTFEIHYHKVIQQITISEALAIAATLDRNRGTSEDFYLITGTILNVNGSTATLSDGESDIKCYATTMPENMIQGYKVTLKGQIQNYYYTFEIVNFEVVEYEEAYYTLTLAETEHGSFEVSKTEDLSYGEIITITAYPDEGYHVKKATVGGRAVRMLDNVGTTTVTGDAVVKVTFTDQEESSEVIPGDGFTIHSLEMVGTYGDANLVQYGNYDILVDGGTASDGANLSKLLADYVEDGILDLIVISHPDSDHYDGIVTGNALNGVEEVKRLIVNNKHSETEKVITKVKNHSADVVVERASQLTSEEDKTYTIDVDDKFTIDIMYSSGYFPEDKGKNNASIPMIVNYKNTKLFMGGDMEESACNSFIQTYPGLFNEDDYVIFKGLHHGSNGSNKDNFLSYLQPDFAFVNAPMKTSDPNKTPTYGAHPYMDAMVRIGAWTTSCYWAGLNGNLTIDCDGEKAAAHGAVRTRDYYYYNKADGSYTLVDKESEKDTPFFESYWYRQAIENLNYPDYCNILS